MSLQTIPLHQAGIPDNPVSLRKKGRHGCVLPTPYLSATREPSTPGEGISASSAWVTLRELRSSTETKTNAHSQVFRVFPSSYHPGGISVIRTIHPETEGQHGSSANSPSPWCLYKQAIVTTARCSRLAYGRSSYVQTSKPLATLLQAQLRACREMGRLARASWGH